MNQSKRIRQKQDIPNNAEKEQYLIEAAAFAASVAEELNDPEAEKIFCPAFKVKACGCVQRFITGGDAGDFPSEGALRRANDLLRLHKEARRLKNKISTDRHDKGDKRVLRMLRAEGFERFILANRLLVRQEMGICERACQRLLFYSNNFLHKDLKTGPEKGPRIKRLGGKKISRQTLRPVSELAKEVCCPDRCVSLVLTHHKMFESWRRTSQTNQQGVRKVVQEMLASKQPNCHKFITMITGCSFSVIYKVREQMKRNLGKMTPTESNNWWHQRSKCNKKATDQLEEDVAMPVPENGIKVNNDVTHHEIGMGSQHDLHRTDMDHIHMPEIQFHFEQPTFSQFIQSLSAVNPSQVVSVPANAVAESPPQSHTLTVLGPASTSSASYMSSQHHFLESNHHHHPSVIISVPESLQGQAISVLTAPNSLEPLTATPFGNVVILPESAIFVPGSHLGDSMEMSGSVTTSTLEL